MAEPEIEIQREGLRIFQQPAWIDAFPDLRQGITGRGKPHFRLPSADLVSAPEPDGWRRLRLATGIDRIARCRQVHGAGVLTCDDRLAPGLNVPADADALVTRDRGLLLAISVADCVPVFLLDPETRTLGLAHAGWRGAAAGVVEATLERMARPGGSMSAVRAHLGPAICGECYEVGPEVPAALGDWPSGTTHVDLRLHVRRSLLAAGVADERITVSPLCTRCEGERLYSHRGGDRQRRMCAFLGWVAR